MSGCGKRGGCDDRKGAMLASAAEWLERLYPERRWGQIDDELAIESGISEDDCMALAEELSDELKAATIYRPGAEDGLCNFIYVLAVGREPCTLQIQHGGAPMPEELAAGDTIEEAYLRIALSAVAPLAVVQEVSVSLSNCEGRWIVSEAVLGGVYSASLLRRFQRMVAIFPAYNITHLDMGEVRDPPADFQHGDYLERFHCEPTQVSYLFYPQPSVGTVTSVLR